MSQTSDPSTPPPEAVGVAVQETLIEGASLSAEVAHDEELPRTATTPDRRRRAFGILLVSLICLGMGGTIMFAVLPQVSRDTLHFSGFQVGFLFVLSGIAWVFSAPFWGRRSDIWGRRPVILIGLLAFGFSSALFPFAIQLYERHAIGITTTYILMIAARVIFGLLGPGAMVASQAYIVDRTTRSRRTAAIATLGASFGIGQVLGPGIGGSLVVIDLLAPFYALSALGFVSALAIWFLLPERTPPRAHQRPPTMSPFDKRILTFVLFSIVLGTAQAIPTQTIGFYMGDVLHFKDAETAVQLVSVGLMASGMAALFSQLIIVQRFQLSASALIRWGLIVSAAAALMMVLAQHYGPLVTALVLSGLGVGMVRPGLSAASSLAVGRDEQGAVAGVMGGMGSLGFVICPMIAMPLYDIRPQVPYILAAVIIVALVGLNFVLPAFRRAMHRGAE